MTLYDVEEATGVRNNTLSKLESGLMNATPKYLERLAHVYQCSPRDFLPDEADPLGADEARLLAAVRTADRSEALRALADCLGVPVSQVAIISNPTRPPGLAEAAERLQTGARELLAAAEALRS